MRKSLILLFLGLIMASYVSGLDVVEISGQTGETTEGELESGRELHEVHLTDLGRKIHYKVPDDGLMPNWCAIANKQCPDIENDVGVLNIPVDTDCLHKCRELSCLTVHHSNGVCELSSKKCEFEGLIDRDDDIYYGRLEEPAEGEERPQCHEGLHPVGLDIFWPTNQYCKTVGVECPAEDMVPARFRPTDRQCMVECNAHSSCMSAQYRDKMCYLREKRCKADKLEQRPGGIDYRRLRMKGEKCPEGSALYVEEQMSYSAKFCMAWGKVCKGHDIYQKAQHIAPFQECLKKCAKIKTCGSVDFFGNQCSPKDYRCSDSELEDDLNVQNFMRLQEGEECPGNRKPPSNEAPWSARFCFKKGWDCELYNLEEEEPLPSADFVDCLTKCVSATDCEGAQFIGGTCQLKGGQCTPDQRIQKEGASLYYRLREGDECAEDSTPPDCGPNSGYVTERSSCPVTCDHQVAEQCDTIDGPSCVCDLGYALAEDGTCKSLTECGCREHDGTKREIGETWISPDCDLESRCELNELDQPIIAEEEKECPALEQCNGASVCDCVQGYSRDEDVDNTCQPDLECEDHSSYHPAGNACPDTCDQPSKEAECTDANKPICLCNHGYIKETDDGKCVPYRQCGCTVEGQEERVRESSWWRSSDCNKLVICSPSMDELPKLKEYDYPCQEFSVCQADQKQHGQCNCMAGYAHHYDGTCKPGIDCETPTIFVPQAKSCQSTCRQPDLGSTCELTNGAGCECPEGMVLGDDQKCVLVDQCTCYDENGMSKNAGDIWMSNDCGAYFTCTHADGAAPTNEEKEHSCQDNAECDVTSGFPQCVCSKGFTPAVDGITCVPDEPPCEETLTTRINAFIKDIMSVVSGGCGSCSDTCRRPTASQTCAKGSKICKCAVEGYLYDESLGKCIPANECGCYDDVGQNRLAGSSWLNLACTKQQTCTSGGEGAPTVSEQLYSCFNCDGRGNCMD